MRFLWFLVVIAGVVFAGGWAFMLTIGIVHHEWWSAVPPIGYWSAVQVVLVPVVATAVSTFVATIINALTGD